MVGVCRDFSGFEIDTILKVLIVSRIGKNYSRTFGKGFYPENPGKVGVFRGPVGVWSELSMFGAV